MGVLRDIGLMLLALSILVVIHEAGHFWAARMFKIRVEKFFLFFDYKFKLFSVKKGDTEYGVGWIPLGGYVKISGMLDESMDEKQVQGPPQPWEFRSKPIWQRLIVMLGGIVMNIILACVIFIGHRYFYGQELIPMKNVEYGIYVPDSSVMYNVGFRTGDQLLNYKGKTFENFNSYADPNLLVDSDKYFEVKHLDGKTEKVAIPDDFINKFQESEEGRLFTPDMKPILFVLDTAGLAKVFRDDPKTDTSKRSFQAYRAGLRTGDRIISIDSAAVGKWSDVQKIIRSSPGMTLNMVVDRKGKEIPFAVNTKAIGRIGVTAYTDTLLVHQAYTFGEAIPKGISAAFGQVGSTVKGLKALVTGNANPTKSLSGPIGIGKILGQGFEANGWEFFWRLTGMLSMVLAVMNLLPIPVLDGGQVLILLIEGVIGREIPIKAKEIIMYIGFFMVLALMGFVILNDIIKLF